MESKTYLNRYRIITGPSGLPIRVVGGAGERTYKAEDTTTGEAVALELVPAGGLHPELLRQLETEAASAKRINHINIPKLYDFGFENDHLVYASELFDGTTAEAWVAAQGPMAVGPVLRIAQQVVGALGAATFHGILHHALNPRNIMIVPGQTTDGAWPLIKVLNFVGVAPEVSAADVASVGAAQFASPEQLENGNVDFRSEIYSLGKTLAFLLTGSALASIDKTRRVPADVKDLIADMTAIDPAERPLDPLAFQREIQELIARHDRGDVAPPPPTFAVTAPQPVATKRNTPALPAFFKPLAWAALLLTILTIAGLGIATSLRSSRDVAKNGKQIGVPIGVPEASTTSSPAAPAPPVTVAPATDVAANASSNNNNTASNTNANSGTADNNAAANTSTNNATTGSVAAANPNPPVLTSDPDPTAPVDTAAPATEPAPAATGNVQQSPQVASNAAPRNENATQPAAPASAASASSPATPRATARRRTQ